MLRTILLTVGVLMASSAAADWTQFLGPDRNGVAEGLNLPKQFSSGTPKEVWAIEVGQGFGGASIEAGRVYILDRHDDERDVLRCVSIRDGKEIWRSTYEVEGKLSFPGSRSTPTIGESQIFTVGSFGHVTCFDKKSGEVVWQKDLRKEFNSPVPNWGFAQSPLLRKGWVIVAAMADKAGIVAFDQKTGDVAWQSDSVGGNTYVSPTVYTIGGVEQIVFVAKPGVSSVHADTGKILWKFDGYKNNIPIPSPLQIDANRLFVTGGYGAGSVAIEVTKNNDDWNVKELWRTDEGSQIHPAAFVNGHIFFNGNTNETLRGGGRNAPGLICMTTEGKKVWQTDNEPSIDRGGMLVLDKIGYLLAGETGQLHLISIDTAAYNEVGGKQVVGGGRNNTHYWGPMAVSNGMLIVRDQEKVKCFDLMPSRRASAQ